MAHNAMKRQKIGPSPPDAFERPAYRGETREKLKKTTSTKEGIAGQKGGRGRNNKTYYNFKRKVGIAENI